MSDSSEVTEGLLDTSETIQILPAAMVRMNGTYTELLKEILQAVTAEPKGESPIVVALQRLCRMDRRWCTRQTKGEMGPQTQSVMR